MVLFRAPGGDDPNRRVYYLMILLGCAALAMYTLREKYAAPSATEPSRQVMVAADPDVKPADPLAELLPHPKLDTLMIRSAVEQDDRDLREAANLLSIAAAVEAAYGWMKTQSHEDLAKRAYGRRRYSFNKLIRYPDRWRMQMLHFHGMVLLVQEVEFPTLPKGARKLFRLTVRDPWTLHIWTILTPVHPDKMREGSMISLDGMFLMRFPYLTQENTWKRTPLLLATRVVLARERATPPELFDERGDPGVTYRDIRPLATRPQLDRAVLDTAFCPRKDGAGVRMMGGSFQRMVRDINAEKAVWDHAFEFLWHYSDEELASMLNPEVDFGSLMEGMQAPEWMRGQMTHVKGVVTFVEPWRSPTSTNGISRIYWVTIADTRYKGFDKTWVALVLNLPEGLRMGSSVEADGVFVKLLPYATREGKWHWSPGVACKALYVRDPSDGASWQYYVIAAALFFVIVLMYARAAKKDTDDSGRLGKHVYNRRLAYGKEKMKARMAGAKQETKALTETLPETDAGCAPDGEEESNDEQS